MAALVAQTSALRPQSVTLNASGTAPFRGVRQSKFRHVYGQSSRRDQCYENVRTSTSAHDAHMCAVNPKFIAVAIEVAGGGAFQVLPLRWTGKVDYHFGRVSGHRAPVVDLQWDPFNDNVIASASEDGVLRLWHIPDDGVRTISVQPLCELASGCRRLSYIQWHPATENVLAAVGNDNRVLVWNVSLGEILTEIKHPDTVYSISWDGTGNMLATTCKDHLMRIFNPRNGELLMEVVCHEGMKASKACFLGKTGYIVTTGFDRSSRRQIALWALNTNGRPIVALEIDSSPGPLFPFFDQDLNIVYVAGKGDGNIRYYELSNDRPFLHFLNEFTSRFPQRGLAVMPKRGLNVSQCEIWRFYKVHTTQPLLEPISFIVPRKSASFQSDIYPKTAAATPSMTCDEWLAGSDRDQITINMDYLAETEGLKVTSKAVQVKSVRLDSQGRLKSQVVTSDRNNDRKFRFLSEAVRPDYRDVNEREDKQAIFKEQEVLQKLAGRVDAGSRQSSTDSTGAELDSPTCESSSIIIDNYQLAIDNRSPALAAIANGDNNQNNSAISHDNLAGPRGGKLIVGNNQHSSITARISSDSAHPVINLQEQLNSSAPPSVRLSETEHSYQNGGQKSAMALGERVQHSPVKIRRMGSGEQAARVDSKGIRISSADDGDSLADTLAKITCAAPIAKIEDVDDDLDDNDNDENPPPDNRPTRPAQRTQSQNETHTTQSQTQKRTDSGRSAEGHTRSLADSCERLRLAPRSSVSSSGFGGAGVHAGGAMRNRSASPRPGGFLGRPSTLISTQSNGQNQTKPGRIGPRMLPLPNRTQPVSGANFMVPKLGSGAPESGQTQTVHQVKPFRIVPQKVEDVQGVLEQISPTTTNRSVLSSKPPIPYNNAQSSCEAPPMSPASNANSAGYTENGGRDIGASNRRSGELEKIYAAQCARVRELLSQCEDKDKRLNKMQTDLADLATKLQQQDSLIAREKGDKDSLRYEIEWKNRRIAFLEEQLHKLDPHGALVASHADPGEDSDEISHPADTDSDRED